MQTSGKQLTECIWKSHLNLVTVELLNRLHRMADFKFEINAVCR